MNTALKEWLAASPTNDAQRRDRPETDQPVTEQRLRQVLRQELPQYLLDHPVTAARKRATK